MYVHMVGISQSDVYKKLMLPHKFIGIAVFHEKRGGGDKRFHKNVNFAIFIMINYYNVGGGSQEDDTQVEGGGGANELFFTKKKKKKKKTGFDNHDRDLCTRRQVPINFKSKSKQNR